MSHIPFLPQAPVRMRSDATPSVALDRRASDAARETFAASLATARADRAPTPRTAAHVVPAARDVTRDVACDATRSNPAAAPHEDDAATTAPSSVQQRASVQALMLSGAMKYAVTRKDAPEAATLPDPVASIPTTLSAATDAAPTIATADAAAANAAVVDPATMAVVIETPTDLPTDLLTATPTIAMAAGAMAAGAMATGAISAAPPQDAAIALPADTALQSLPAVIAIPVDATELAPAPTADVGIDLSSTNAAIAAALQLVAQLPIAPSAVTQPPVQELPSDATATTPSNGAATSASLGDAVASQPAQSGTMLVEDHFDAPAAALADGMISSTTSMAAVPATALADGMMSSTTSMAAVPATTATSTPAMSSRATSAESIASTDTTPATPLARPSTTAQAPSVAAAPATAATATAGRTDVTAMQTDMAALDPAFRDRLEKVIDRMRDEFGRAVTVVETVRSQARQDALFAQGRTAPGAIVTWTKNSKHGKGLAADLVVDGSWQNPAGYAELAAVARQEGLRTLGSRDPGHVELPTEGAVSGETLGNLLNDLQGDAGNAARQMRADVNTGGRNAAHASMMAQVSNVAQVARVASVAQVAKVASVSRPGAAPAQPAAASDTVSPLAVTGVSNIAASSDAAAVMRVATPTTAVNMSDRISHLMDLQATQDARPLNSVLLRMDNANGIEDQIRIDTRGTNVDARLGLGNAQQAAILTDRLGELRDALERRGLSADGVRVQAGAMRTADTVTLSKPSAQVIELAAMRAAADSQANGNTRDQTSRDQQLQREALARDTARHTPRSSSDDPRHRSRREQPEDRR